LPKNLANTLENSHFWQYLLNLAPSGISDAMCQANQWPDTGLPVPLSAKWPNLVQKRAHLYDKEPKKGQPFFPNLSVTNSYLWIY